MYVWISIALFLACLVTPAFYVREPLEAAYSYGLLLNGWLGVLDGHYSWFANPLYFIALVVRKPERSWWICLVALGVALTFLLENRILADAGGYRQTINAYGFGYMLWILSILILAAGHAHRLIFEGSQPTALSLILIAVFPSSVFGYHYFAGDDSRFTLVMEQKKVFETQCKQVEHKVYKTVNDTRGIYLNSIYESSFRETDHWWYKRWHPHDGGSIHGRLNSGWIEFYEENNSSTSSKYLRHNSYNSVEETDTLRSKYAVITDRVEISRKLGVSAAKVTIKNIKTGEPLALTSYAYDSVRNRFCGHSVNGKFSVGEFVDSTLGLHKRFPSSFDDN